jgi:hypothetical protein
MMSDSDASANGSIRFMSVSHHHNGGSWWLVSASVISILSGAATTGLLRAPIGGPAVASATLTAHMIIGVATASVAVWYLARSRKTRAQVAIALVAAAVVSGWSASRSFTPFAVAGHAIAAFAPLALLVDNTRALAWPPRAARVGFVLLLLQVALAALVRHRVIGLTSHVLVGGLAATAVLVPAVAVTQGDEALVVVKRAARWAIAALLVQAFLGASLLLMVAAGTDNVPMWAAAINAHVLVGTLALLAAAALSYVLAAG